MTLVRKFHDAFNLPAADSPTIPDAELIALRARLIREECEEVVTELEALMFTARRNAPIAFQWPHLQNLLKELADLRYVVEGAAVTFGLDIEGAYAEVHRSNMSKLDSDGNPLYREDGKVLKGPNYTEADMTKFVPGIPTLEEGDITCESDSGSSGSTASRARASTPTLAATTRAVSASRAGSGASVRVSGSVPPTPQYARGACAVASTRATSSSARATPGP